MTLSHKKEHNKKALLKALEKTRGIVTTACEIVGIGRTTFYDYVRNDEEFKKDVGDIDNIAIDFAESALHKNIESGKEASIIFYLKTKGKGRGYIERQEITGKDGGSIEITGFNYVKPDED
jgi:hypothetical protein